MHPLITTVPPVREDIPPGLSSRLTDSIELVNWTGRIVRESIKVAIPEHFLPVSFRFGIDGDNWIYQTQHIENPFKSLVGTAISMKILRSTWPKLDTGNVALCAIVFQ